MFKISFAPHLRDARIRRWTRRLCLFVQGLSLLFLAALSACRTAPPLTQVDLAEPGWVVHQGQAAWRARRGAPEIAGELLLAARRDGSVFLQFSKTPFPIVTARVTTNGWQIEFPSQNRRYAGRGAPSPRLIWFQLPRAISGSALPTHWVWRDAQSSGWRLENLSTGESLEGYFTP